MLFQKSNWWCISLRKRKKSWVTCTPLGAQERRKMCRTLLCPQQGRSSGDGAAGVVGGPAGICVLVHPRAELSLVSLLVCGAQHCPGADDWRVSHTLLYFGVLQLAWAGEKWLNVVLDGRLAGATVVVLQRDALKENIHTRHHYVTFWPAEQETVFSLCVCETA